MTATDIKETVTSSKQTVVTAAVEKKYVTFEALAVSETNTITLGDFTTIAGAVLLKKSDGATVTFTKATNVLTVTEADLTNIDLVGFAYGT
jgi:uncharacterized protein (DUF927 family)